MSYRYRWGDVDQEGHFGLFVVAGKDAMGTQTGRTTSDSAQVTDVGAAREFLEEEYRVCGNLGTVHTEVSGSGELSIWGMDTVHVVVADTGEHVPVPEFLCELGAFLADGEQFEMRVVGGIKARHPPVANRWVVDDDSTVRYWDLEGAEGKIVREAE